MRGLLIDTATGDLLVRNGALQVGDTTHQTIELVLCSMRGEWKEAPTIGGEVPLMLSGVPSPLWTGEVRKMLLAVGVDAHRVDVNDGEITVSTQEEGGEL